jgi:hypothetical protein
MTDESVLRQQEQKNTPNKKDSADVVALGVEEFEMKNQQEERWKRVHTMIT